MTEDFLGGRYRILSPLGAGGMGEVFLTEDTRLERRVTVKLLPASTEADAVLNANTMITHRNARRYRT